MTARHSYPIAGRWGPVEPAASPLPQRAFNRWTLEPVLFFIPLLATIVLGAFLYVMLVSWGVAGLVAAVLLVALILALSALGLRRKR